MLSCKVLKDTHREKELSNETPVLSKSTNMGIWDVSEALKLKQYFQKYKVVTGKYPFLVTGSFCSHHFICLSIGF